MSSLQEASLPGILSGVIPSAFYEQSTLEIARQLLGKTLVVIPEGDESRATAGIIVETEGYVGPEDPACHAYVGRTRRNDIMWGPPGLAYVYFTYGNHWMINAVTGPDGYAAAALIRAVQPVLGVETMRDRRGLHLLKGKVEDRQLTNGPGKLCQAMGINGSYNGQPLTGPRLYIVETPLSLQLPPFEVVETTRIGISRGKDFPWRYYVKGNRYVSRL
ncbi:MAG: 3-methyladenine glycosylase [Chloroflexi bacterium]|jgi:DNA-3-methyladenine glycosylase|nr:3-methyladenine glycosylase [Chloroflexota bacterium]